MAAKRKQAPEETPAATAGSAKTAKMKPAPTKPASRKPANAAPKKPAAKKSAKTGTHGKHAKRPTAAEQALIDERRQFVWGLYRRRINEIKITQHLIGKREHIGFRDLKDKVNAAGFTACLGTVHADIEFMRKERKERLAIDNDTQFAIDLDRLDDMQAAIASRVEKHAKPDDIKTELAIMDRRDRYLGISKGQQSENALHDKLTKLLGFDPEAPIDADGDTDKV